MKILDSAHIDMGAINMDNLFEKAIEWYRKGGDYRRAACELFSEKELEKYENERKKSMMADRDKMLQEMLIRCKKLFPIGSLIQGDNLADRLPNLTISEPYIQYVKYLPLCVNYSSEYKDGERKTIFVDTVRIRRNEPCGKSQVCLEQLLYYMDKPDGDNFKKKGFIDLKEYEKKQIEKKNEELTYLKTLAEKIEQDLDDTKKSIAEVEAYNPSELTEQKLKDILKDVTETH